MPRNESAYETFMRRAIELAKIALSKGDTPVGSLTVRDGRILGEGIEAVKTRIDISAHAEMIAIRQACRALGTLDLSGCAIYTTAEPCFMCSYAIRQTRISEVIIEWSVAQCMRLRNGASLFFVVGRENSRRATSNYKNCASRGLSVSRIPILWTHTA